MRDYKRKSERGSKSQEVYEQAAKEVLENGKKIREAAALFELCHVSLFRYIKKKKNNLPLTVGYTKPRQVFSPEQKEKITAYLLKCADIYFGLLPSEVKKLAHQCAVAFGVKNIPASWHKHGMAGADWFTKFMERNPRLSLRTPEATSLSRATSFNQTNVSDFFQKYGSILQKHNMNASRIWNIDETGVTTVQKPKKIVAARGQKQVGAMTSAERGTLVTLVCAVSAAGNSVPPMFVFPRIRYSNLFIQSGPPDCIGAGNSSGWMTENEFVKFIEHFIQHVKPTEQEPVILLLDNHSSHVNIEVVRKAKEHHIIMLSFPPHCSHKLQPLDVGVYGPFKNYVNRTQTSWMASNAGKTMSIYDIPAIVRDSLPLALNPSNIISGFRATGLWPLNPNIFQNSDFAGAFVTDRPNPTEEMVAEQASLLPSDADLTLGLEDAELLESVPQVDISITEVINQLSDIQPIPTEPVPGPSGIQNMSSGFSPSKIRPLPKAPPRKKTNRVVRKRKSAVLTDTPEKEALEKEFEEKMIKKQKQEANSKNKGKGKGIGKGKSNRPEKTNIDKVKKKVFNEDSDSEEEEWLCLICGDKYSKSDKEDWIECMICKLWSHVKCVRGDPVSYICINCEFDED